MPLPPERPDGYASRDEMDEAYEKAGWSKEITFDWIHLNMRTGQAQIQTYRFQSISLKCGKADCDRYQPIYIQLAPSGVIQTCANCRKTDGPIAFEEGILEEVRVTQDRNEIEQVLKKSGQFILPKILDKILPQRRRGPLFKSP